MSSQIKKMVFNLLASAACLGMGHTDLKLSQEMRAVQPPIPTKYADALENSANLKGMFGAAFFVAAGLQGFRLCRSSARSKPQRLRHQLFNVDCDDLV